VKITIYRLEVELITRHEKILETTEYTAWVDAFAYLEKQLGVTLSEAHKEAFEANQYTTTNPRKEIVIRPDAGYLADVYYAVEVSE